MCKIKASLRIYPKISLNIFYTINYIVNSCGHLHLSLTVCNLLDCADVGLGELDPVLLTQRLVLLDGDRAVPAKVKLLEHILECCN